MTAAKSSPDALAAVPLQPPRPDAHATPDIAQPLDPAPVTPGEVAAQALVPARTR